MNYMEVGIAFVTCMGDGSKPVSGNLDSLLHVGKRMLTGESIFKTHFTNADTGKKRVVFATPYPGKIIALDMAPIGEELNLPERRLSMRSTLYVNRYQLPETSGCWFLWWRRLHPAAPPG